MNYNHKWINLRGRTVCKHCGLHVDVVPVILGHGFRMWRRVWHDLRGARHTKMPRCCGPMPLAISVGG